MLHCYTQGAFTYLCHGPLIICVCPNQCACSGRPLFASRVTGTFNPLCSPLSSYLPSWIPTHPYYSPVFAPRTAIQFLITHYFQPTKFQHDISAIHSLNVIIAKVIVNHVMAGASRTVAQLRSQPSTHVQQGSRLGFDLCDNLQHRKTSDYSHSLLQQRFLNDTQYLSLQVMGAAATALNATVIVAVKCPGPRRTPSTSGPYSSNEKHRTHPSLPPDYTGLEGSCHLDWSTKIPSWMRTVLVRTIA